jgi:hypothetical protein
MTRNATVFAAIATVTALGTATSASTLAFSSFANGNEGWSMQAGPGATNYNATWNAAGGTPDGHIQFWDTSISDAEFFMASSTFVGSGNFSSAVANGGVSFNWKTDFLPAGQTIQIAFDTTYAGGTILWAETTAVTGMAWNHYDFAFDTSVQWWSQSNGVQSLATMADLNGALASVSGLYITGDLLYGLDGTCSLDSPRIYSVPAPGALALLGVAAMLGTRRRKLRS